MSWSFALMKKSGQPPQYLSNATGSHLQQMQQGHIFRCHANATGSHLQMSWFCPMFFWCLPAFGHFLVRRIYLSNFYVKHKFSCFRGLKESRTWSIYASPNSLLREKELKKWALCYIYKSLFNDSILSWGLLAEIMFANWIYEDHIAALYSRWKTTHL